MLYDTTKFETLCSVYNAAQFWNRIFMILCPLRVFKMCGALLLLHMWWCSSIHKSVDISLCCCACLCVGPSISISSIPVWAEDLQKVSLILTICSFSFSFDSEFSSQLYILIILCVSEMTCYSTLWILIESSRFLKRRLVVGVYCTSNHFF